MMYCHKMTFTRHSVQKKTNRFGHVTHCYNSFEQKLVLED